MSRTQETEEVTNIDFPRSITYDEARDLCKFLVVNLDGNPEISLNTERTYHFGDRFEERKEATVDEVSVRISNEGLSGIVHRGVHRGFTHSASFTMKQGFDFDHNSFYTGIDFNVTPGYEPGQLSSDNVEIMRDTRLAVQKYFSKKR